MALANQLTLASCNQAIARTAQWSGQEILTADLGDPHFVALGLYKGLAAFHSSTMESSTRKLREALECSTAVTGEFHPMQALTVFDAATQHASHRGSNLYASAFSQPLDLARNYRNAWFCWGAHLVGANALCTAGLNLLEKTLHAELGAAHHSNAAPEHARIYDLGTNASVANTFLQCGRVEAALRVGEFMKRLVMAQSADATDMVLALDTLGKPLQLEQVSSKVAKKLYFLSTANTDQVYWLLGFAIKVFASLHRETGNTEWLVPAQRILIWLNRCPTDFVHNVTSAKIGWGAAEMFKQTGDIAWRDLAIRVTHSIVTTQSPNGIWIRPDFPRWVPQPLLVSMDTSIERMFYLREIPHSLRDGGAALAN